MVDLHTHSIYSDGALSIEELVNNGVKNGVEVMSITDHDTILGIKEYSKKINNKIIVVPGVEFSTDTYFLGKRTKIHMLGYGYRVDDKSINKVLSDLYSRHYEDNKTYIEELIPKFSYLSNEYFNGFNYSKSGWLYKHILNFINSHLNKKQIEELREYLINNKPNYNRYNERTEDVIELMKKCGGYAVFAHPQKCNLSREELNVLVRYLTDIGLDGLETYHIDSVQSDREIVHSVALEYGLYETGGSDFHSFLYGDGVGDSNINFPDKYDCLLVKRLIKENKVLGGKNE